MSHKAFTQVFVLALILLAFLAIPGNAQAGGGCGGTYIVQGDETLDVIAWRCDTTISDLYAANPGISGYLYAGQTLVIPGGDYNYYNNYNYYAPVSYSNTYIVQVGDTFSGIASRYGVSVSDLWAANPYIWNINYLYAGQVINVPASSWYPYMPTPIETPTSLSYGTVPSGSPKGSIILSNKTNADVYVSLQGTTRDGSEVINEYWVSGSMKVNVPVGWYIYVAWVGGQKFEGQFNLGGGSDHVITFHSKKVVVE